MSVESEAPDTNAVLRGLLDVAKVALGPDMPTPSAEEVGDLLFRLLAIIDATMPPDLQAQDIRVISAKILADRLRQ